MKRFVALSIAVVALVGTAGCAAFTPSPVEPTIPVVSVETVRQHAATLAKATIEAATIAVEARRLAESSYHAGVIGYETIQRINQAAIDLDRRGQAFISFAETVTSPGGLRVSAEALYDLFDGFLAKLSDGGSAAASKVTAIRAALAAFRVYLQLDAGSSVLVDGRCPYCLKEGRSSTVTITGCTSTLLAFSGPSFNEQGQPIPYVDRNTTTCGGVCSRGHLVSTISGGA